MENSMDDAETQQTFQSPPRRRRSTFFERRDSVAPQPLSVNAAMHVDEKNTNHEELQELTRYYGKLLAEKEQWKREVTERRHKYHDLRQQYQMVVKAPNRSRMSYSALTNDDIQFLKGKPNLSKLVDSQQKLHKSVKETAALVRRVNELEDVALKFCKEKVNKISEYILENSTVEPVE